MRGRRSRGWVWLQGAPQEAPLRPEALPPLRCPHHWNYLSLSLDFRATWDKTLRWAEAPADSQLPPALPIRLSGLSQRRPNHDHEPCSPPLAPLRLRSPSFCVDRPFRLRCLKGRPTGLGLPVPGRGFSPSGRVWSNIGHCTQLRGGDTCMCVRVCVRACACVPVCV